MIATGIIESNDRYSTGQPGIISPFTKSYRLASKYRTGQSRLHELSSRPTIGKVIKAYEVDPENLKAAGIHYRSCFDQFTLDGAAATDPNLTNQWDRWTIARWFNGQEFAHRCVYGRYHSLMTQLPRHARRHLQTLGHDALSVVDVSACQPLLLGYLASQATAHATPGTPLLPYVARFSKSSVIRNTVPYDLAWWIELCESGSIYRHFYQEIQTHVGSTTTTIITPTGQRRDVDLRAYSEKQIKRASLIPIFDKIDAMKRSPIFAIILRDFPTVASFIVSAKQNGHQDLACRLQRTESALMIDGLGGVLNEHYESVPVAPIHDAIVVPGTFVEKAAELVRDQFQALGLHPQVKIETCSEVPKSRAQDVAA